MKKTTLKRISLLCALFLIVGAIISTSSCGWIMIGDEGIYENALEKIEEARSLAKDKNTSRAVDEYEKAIAQLEEIPDYSETAATLEEAKREHDKLVMEQVKLCYQYDYFRADDWLARLYDQKKAESVTIWKDFSQDLLLGYYEIIVDALKSELKDPNSFTDVGTTFTYTTAAGTKENTVIIKKLYYNIDYTATNSFGGVVRNKFEYTFDDIEYTFESEYLTAAEVAEIVKHTDFNSLYAYLTE